MGNVADLIVKAAKDRDFCKTLIEDLLDDVGKSSQQLAQEYKSEFDEMDARDWENLRAVTTNSMAGSVSAGGISPKY